MPNGGNFDGDLGSLAALGALEALAAANLRTRHPLEMVIWSAEESATFTGLNGSRIVAGEVKPSDMEVVWNGMTRADAIRKIGGDPGRITEAVRPRGAHHCYLELHIEQGGTLERDRIPVGVVEGIVAIDRYEVTVSGFANHAGTTPMAERQDALLAASHLTIAVRQIVTSEPGRQVGTVGRLEVTPNSPNVIPGVVRLTIELRDLSAEKLTRLAERIRRRAARDRERHEDVDRVRVQQSHRAGDGGRRGPARDRAKRATAGSRHASHAQRRRPRCADDGAALPDGHDLRAERARHQPLAARAHGMDDCARGADVLLNTVLEVDRIRLRRAELAQRHPSARHHPPAPALAELERVAVRAAVFFSQTGIVQKDPQL